MTDHFPTLPNPPIIEAVIDIDCDLPPDLKIAQIAESAKSCFAKDYPKYKTRKLFSQQFEVKDGAEPKISEPRQGVHAHLFLSEDERQLVQVRSQGFSFNRLSPYTSLDDYLPQMEATWTKYVEISKPFKITCIRIRYINKFFIPSGGARVELNDYLKRGPRLPDEDRLAVVGFLNKYSAIDRGTGHHVAAILTMPNFDNGMLPIIFDITTASDVAAEPENWGLVVETISSLRVLKNSVFFNTLEERCLQLFQ